VPAGADRVAYRAFAGGVGRACHDGAADRHRRRPAAVEVDGVARAERAHHGGLLLEVQACRVAGARPSTVTPARVRGLRRRPNA